MVNQFVQHNAKMQVGSAARAGAIDVRPATFECIDPEAERSPRIISLLVPQCRDVLV